MKRSTFNWSVFFLASLLVPGLLLGCYNTSADDKAAKEKDAKAGQNDAAKPRVLETVDLAPGKAITPQDQAKISSLAIRVLAHVSNAQKDIETKNIDGAKKELTQAVTLVDIIKELLPTVKVIDHIWVAKTKLSYLDTTEVQQDLITISSSIDQIYDMLPEGKAKDSAKNAKENLSKDKQNGAAKVKENLEAVEEALDFREVDMSISLTSQLIMAAQSDLQKDKTKEASDSLKAVTDGLMFFDAAVVNPLDLAARRIWMATQEYTAKDYKTAKTRLMKAKTALQDVAAGNDKALQAGAKDLIAKIDALDVTKADDKTATGLQALWNETQKLLEQPQHKAKK